MSFNILENYKIKLLSLLFAIFIWFFVITENEYSYVIAVPVRVVNIPNDKIILNDIPQMVKARIRGDGKNLIALLLGRGARINLDLSDAEQSQTFHIRPNNVFVSRAEDIRIEEIIAPDSITVLLDDYQSKKLPIASRVFPMTAAGYTVVGDIAFTPDSVRVSGPASVLATIDNIPTEKLELHNLKFDVKDVVNLAPPASEKVQLSLHQVEFYINIQKLLQLTITGVPIKVKNVPPNLSVHVVPSTLSLIVEGGGDLLTDVTRNDIEAYIDYNRVKDSPGKEHPAVIEPPPGVSYRGVKPKTFRLIFEN